MENTQFILSVFGEKARDAFLKGAERMDVDLLIPDIGAMSFRDARGKELAFLPWCANCGRIFIEPDAFCRQGFVRSVNILDEHGNRLLSLSTAWLFERTLILTNGDEMHFQSEELVVTNKSPLELKAALFEGVYIKPTIKLGGAS